MFEHIRDLPRQAIVRDPTYAEAYATLADAMVLDYLNRWTANPHGSLTEARTRPAKPDQLRFGRFTLDLIARSLSSDEGEAIALTSTEFDLLQALATHPNRVLSRDQLLDLTDGRAAAPFDRSIDIRVTRLRHKIETDPNRPAMIKTVRGAGYVFVPDESR